MVATRDQQTNTLLRAIPSVDVRQHKILPAQKETDQYQVITLGLKLPSGETVREAFLESKED